MKKTIIINDTSYTKNAVLPIKKQYALNKSLDMAVLTLKNVLTKEPFEPLQKVYINKEIFLISKDDVTQTMFGEIPKYQHDLSLIEETKLLERYFVDTCTFTSPINEVSLGQSTVYPQIWDNKNYDISIFGANIHALTSNVFSSPQATENLIQIPSWGDLFNNRDATITMTGWFRDASWKIVVSKDGEEVSRLDYSQDATQHLNILLREGTYTITYTYAIRDHYLYFIPGSYTDIWSYSYTFKVIPRDEQYTRLPLTITDCVNKLLNITEINRLNTKSVFSFNTEQIEKYSSITSPEFNISNCNLREALNQIGGYIHAEVRLKDGVIYYDDLSGKEIIELPKNHVAYTSTHDVADFCSGLESNVKNIISDDVEQYGNTTEPYYSGYTTTRTETGNVRVTESTCFIPTRHKIQKIINVKCFLLTDNSYVGDITDYVLENTHYNAKSSYEQQNKFDTKSMFLKYTQGARNITGLDFEMQDIWTSSGYFTKFSMTNIINDVLETNYNDDDIKMEKLQFQITYQAIIDARIKQFKPNLKSTKTKAMLQYNQSDFKVSSTFYGENLKGAISRLGLAESFYTYLVGDDYILPKIGQRISQNEYITVVREEDYNDYKKITVGVSKDFNNLSEFVGIKNEQRFYEISEKQAVERDVVYDDFLIVGDNVDLESDNNDKAIITDDFVGAVKSRLVEESGIPEPYYQRISCMTFSPLSRDLTPVLNNEIILPTVTMSCGNSAEYLTFFENNYGAGNYIGTYTALGGGAGDIGLQDELNYTDGFGEFEYLSMNGYTIPFVGGRPNNYADSVNVGKDLPKLTIPNGQTRASSFFSTSFGGNDYPFLIKKDNREQINFSYQIHCVTNRDDIIIGSGLAKTLCVQQRFGQYERAIVDAQTVGTYYVKSYQTPSLIPIYTAKTLPAEYVAGTIYYSPYKPTLLFAMPRAIGGFERTISDVPNESQNINFTMVQGNKEISFNDITINADAKSLVLVDRETHELLFAINGDFTNGQNYEMPKLMFRHKVFQ